MNRSANAKSENWRAGGQVEFSGSGNQGIRRAAPALAVWMATSLFLGVVLSGCAGMRGPMAPEKAGKLPPGGEVDLSQFFCLNAITPFHHKVSTDPEVQKNLWKELRKQLKVARDLGASHIRVDMWWGIIEPERGQFEWDFPDRVIDEIKAAGLEPYPILCYNAAWSPDASPATDEARAQFANYAYQLINRYKDKVRLWEVWNEPNITPFWVPEPDAALYVDLLREVYAKAKEADPTCTIVGFCTAGADLEFIKEGYEHGAKDYIDAVSFHHYSDLKEEGVLEGEIRAVRQIMRRYGDQDKPVLITELGLSTGPSPILTAYDEEEQASWMIKKHLVSIAGGIAQLYWFKMKDDKSETEPDGYWGLVRHDYSEKPSAVAYRQMTALLKDAQYIGSPHSLATNRDRNQEVALHLFQKNDEVVACGWVRNEGKPLKIKLPADDPIELLDVKGGSIKSIKPNSAGYVEIELTSAPCYVCGLPMRALPLASLQFEPDPVILAPGETKEAFLVIDNPLEDPLEVKLGELQKPPAASYLMISAAKDSVTAPGKTVTRVPLRISLAKDAPKFTAREFVFADDLKYTYKLRVEYTPPFDVQLLVTSEKYQGKVTTRFTNRMERAVSGQVTWQFGGRDVDREEPFVDLKPGATASVEKKLGISLSATELTAHVTTDDGVGASASLGLYGQPLIKKAPEIDGRLDDWNERPALPLTPDTHQTRPEKGKLDAEDIGGRLWVAWTNDHLFLAADVTDDNPLVNPHKDTEIWKGDSLELYLGFGGPTEEHAYTERDFQLGISPGNKGKAPVVWNWKARAAEGETPPEGGAAIPEARVAVRKTDSGYALEADIPLKSLGETIRPYQFLGFNVHLNDRDDPKSLINDAVLIWNGTGMDWRDPSGWGVAVVVPEE